MKKPDDTEEQDELALPGEAELACPSNDTNDSDHGPSQMNHGYLHLCFKRPGRGCGFGNKLAVSTFTAAGPCP